MPISGNLLICFHPPPPDTSLPSWQQPIACLRALGRAPASSWGEWWLPCLAEPSGHTEGQEEGDVRSAFETACLVHCWATALDFLRLCPLNEASWGLFSVWSLCPRSMLLHFWESPLGQVSLPGGHIPTFGLNGIVLCAPSWRPCQPLPPAVGTAALGRQKLPERLCSS